MTHYGEHSKDDLFRSLHYWLEDNMQLSPRERAAEMLEVAADIIKETALGDPITFKIERASNVYPERDNPQVAGAMYSQQDQCWYITITSLQQLMELINSLRMEQDVVQGVVIDGGTEPTIVIYDACIE